MIRFSDVKKEFGGDPLFSNMDFTIHPGEKIAFVGRNGTGKSTIIRLILGDETPDQGNIQVPKNYRIGALKQHSTFTQPTVLEEASLGLPPEKRDHIYLVEKILFGLGLSEEQLHQPTENLSGGFHLRVKLAKVLLSEPDCLLLDEPTNYLDIVSIRWLEKFLKKWRQECLIISHDRSFLDAVSTHTMGIHRKKIRKYRGNTENYYNQLLQEEEIHEKTRQNLEKKRAHTQSFIDKLGGKASKAKQAQSRKKALAKLPSLEKLSSIDNLNFQFREANFTGKKILNLDQVYFSYDQDPLIENLSLHLEKGSRTAILGKNGRGKSTILRLLEGGLQPLQGSVEKPSHLPIGYFGQTNIDRLNPSMTIEEEITQANPQLNLTEIRQICGLMMFSSDKAKKTIRVLSGGERSRVLLGKILAKPCHLLLLDEPSHHLDVESTEAMLLAIEQFQGTVVIVTHNEQILNSIDLDGLILCEHTHQTYFQGDYQDFLEKIGWKDEGPPKKKKEKKSLKKDERKQLVTKLKREVSSLEEQIIGLESQIEKIQKELIEASKEGSSSISSLSNELTQAENKLEKLNDQWELTTKKLEETN